MVPLQLMSISGKELHVPVLPLHVAERPFLGRGHPNGLGRGLQSLGLSPRRGRLGRWTRSLWRLRGLGRRCWDGLFGRHRLRGLRLVFGAGRAASSLRGWLGWRLRGWQEPAQLRLRASQALKPRGGPHCQPFLLRIILLVVVQENRKGNAGPAGNYDVAVYICQFEAQGAQGNGAVQFHEMALVGSCFA